MLSLKWITLAYIIGILWGLYLELSTLIVTSIFLFILGLMFARKFHFEIVILSAVCIFGCLCTEVKLNKYDEKYSDESELNLNVTIISQAIEKDYTYKYSCKSENGDKFILYFKKNMASMFEIGDEIYITGEFNLPDVARNGRTVLITEDI